MAARIKKEDVVHFLVDMKTILSRENSLLLVERRKNLQFLAASGHTIDDARMILFSLSTKNYSDGPQPDHDSKFPGDIWIFGCLVDGLELYIKMKLVTGEFHQVICISFHEAQWPLTYPFKG
ncbi:MAG: type II toxin-antitoxin system MqsR family toxin [Firmicutes bacterium]|nr:type II toxin-antitoxin system MqsR family toxin [Bacillota bacterium]